MGPDLDGAPGSKVVTGYYEQPACGPTSVSSASTSSAAAGDARTSGPLPEGSRRPSRRVTTLAFTRGVLSATATFEGRIGGRQDELPRVAAMVIAYGRPGRWTRLRPDPLSPGRGTATIFLKDIWPGRRMSGSDHRLPRRAGTSSKDYADVFAGDERWHRSRHPEGNTFAWDADSTLCSYEATV